MVRNQQTRLIAIHPARNDVANLRSLIPEIRNSPTFYILRASSHMNQNISYNYIYHLPVFYKPPTKATYMPPASHLLRQHTCHLQVTY